MEAFAVTGLPSASTETWAPPPVISRMRAGTSSVAASTAASAPRPSAWVSFSATTSTTTTRAPIARPSNSAESPMPPVPWIASHSPG